jgi:hypothetical protein
MLNVALNYLWLLNLDLLHVQVRRTRVIAVPGVDALAAVLIAI